jgi:hypothetical protein
MKAAMKPIGQSNLSSQRRVLRALMAAGLLIGLLILFLVPPADLPFPECAFHAITGHSCLTCGMTRSLHAISHGELSVSIRRHLFGPAVFIGMLLCFAILTVESISGKRSEICPSRRTKKRIFALFAIVWIVYWGVRIVSECSAT